MNRIAVPILAFLIAVGCSQPHQTPDRPDFGPVTPSDPSNKATPYVEALTGLIVITLPTTTSWRVMAGIPSLHDSTSYPLQQYPKVVTRNMSTGECTWTTYGTSTGYITADLQITLGNQGDAFDSPAGVSDIFMYCLEAGSWHYYYFKPPVGFQGNGLSHAVVHGGTGGDWIACNTSWGGNGDYWCDGGSGNDYLETRRSDGSVTLLGGDMQDTLSSTSPNPAGAHLSGGYGGDCIKSNPQLSAANSDCGPDFDASTGILGSNCESLVTACQ